MFLLALGENLWKRFLPKYLQTLGAPVVAIGDWLTALVALVSLIVLFRWKVSNPLLVAAAAVVGLIAFPLLRPEWIFVK